MTIREQIFSALNAATFENGYAHEYERPAVDIVLEIHDWSGIEGFDPANKNDMINGVFAVLNWRAETLRLQSSQAPAP